MKYCQLRIAWSVVSSVTCLLLVLYWVRSDVIGDTVCIPINTSWSFKLQSAVGRVIIAIEKSNKQAVFDVKSAELNYWSMPTRRTFGEKYGLRPIIYWDRSGGVCGADLHYWFLVLVAGLCAAAPWFRELRLRFSLRSLLIATTLMAVGLWLAVWTTGR
jgi:hypothetical protein